MPRASTNEIEKMYQCLMRPLKVSDEHFSTILTQHMIFNEKRLSKEVQRRHSHFTVKTETALVSMYSFFLLPSSFPAKQIGIEFSAKGNQNYSLLQAVYFSYSFYTRPNMKGLKGRLIWLAEHLENWKKKQTPRKEKSECSLFTKKCF